MPSFLLLALGLFAHSAWANPMTEGHWKAVDYSVSPAHTIFLSISGQQMVWQDMVGKELFDLQVAGIRFPDDFTVEIQDQKSMTWTKAFDMDLAAWKMRWCPPGKTTGCKDFAKEKDRTLFVPSYHSIPEDPVTIRLEALSKPSWEVLWTAEVIVDPKLLFSDHTSDSEFGKKSVIEFVTPDLQFKIRYELTSYYFDDLEFGTKVTSYGFMGKAILSELVSQKVLLTWEIGSTYGLSAQFTDPTGSIYYNLQTR
ncbi:MAG: hypothetical protein JNL01_03300 [Bdellovibrionales bacterium]|nr:hypothetical protein [Bdellovibrionales bacterium]